MSRSPILLLACWLLAAAAPAAATGRPGESVPLPPPPALGRSAPWSGAEGWRLTPSYTLGAWTDDTTRDVTTGWQAGLEAEWRLAAHHTLLAEARLGSYRRLYLTEPATPGGPLARADVGERDAGGRLLYGYELLHHLGVGGRLRGELLVGGFYRGFSNRAAPATAAGPLVGTRLDWRVADPLEAGLELTYGYAASASGATAPLSTRPKGLTTGFAGVGIRASGARLRLGYRLDLVTLESANRRFDGVTLLLDLGL